MSSLPGAVTVVPADTGEFVMASAGAGFGGAASQQATRHARRIYMGGLPPSAREDSIASFLSSALTAIGGTTAGPGSCVVNVYLNHEKKFAFVELRTVEETSNAMALDNVVFEGVNVRIRRPADYRPKEAAALGPSAPNPNLNLAAIGLERPAAPVQAVVPGAVPGEDPTPHDGGERIFVGGLPRYLTDEQCQELLGSFGAVKSFDLIKDRESGMSKGYGFVVYQDPSVTDIAIAGLHGMRMGDRSLTVKRSHSSVAYQEQKTRTQHLTGQTEEEMPPPPPPSALGAPPRVVKLVDAVTLAELENDEDYNDILEDMKEECSKYGEVAALHIPRQPAPGQQAPPGLGKIIVEYDDSSAAIAARNALHGRRFGGRTVQALLMSDEDYGQQKWD